MKCKHCQRDLIEGRCPHCEQESRTINTGTLHRTMTFDRSNVDEEKRTVELSFSSEDPVERWFGSEVLDHSKKSVRLDRLKKSGPLLVDHDRTDHVGVLEEVLVGTDRMGRCVARFGKSARAEEIFQDVLDGIRVNVSVGYQIHRMVLEEESDEGSSYRATDWEPLEVSLVSIPADTTVGVGRSEPDGDHQTVIVNEPESREKESPVMKCKSCQRDLVDGRCPHCEEEARKVIVVETRKAEGVRIREITAIGARFDQSELARTFIDTEKSVADFRTAVMEKMGKAQETNVPSRIDLDLSDNDDREYSIVRALSAAATGDWARAGLEREISQAIAKKLGRDSEGLFVPTGLSLRAPAIAGTDGSGGHTVATETMSIIEMLRNRLVVRELGATILTGLEGNLSFPTELTDPTLNWSAENPGSDTGDFDATNMFGELAMSPKSAIATVPFSKQLLAQSSLDIENFVRMKLAKVNALGLDLESIAGPGTGNRPTGILSTSGIGSVVGGTDGAAPDWADIINLETEVAVDNADIGSLAYLTNAKVRGKLKQSDKGTDTGKYVWAEGETPLNGYRAGVSNQVPSNLVKGASGAVCSAILFGNWEDLYIGEWGVLELLADPYALKKQGLIEVTSFMLCDIGVARAASFAAMQDALTT